MQIGQVSKSDAVGGGASTVAVYLGQGLSDFGVPNVHYCLYAGSGFDYHRRPLGGFDNPTNLERHKAAKHRYGLAEVFPLEAEFLIEEARDLGLDLFQFHDISSAVSVTSMSRLARHRPVVWTMHDCSPFTGGCLYPMDCTKAQRRLGCIGCPQAGQWPIDTRFDTAWLNLMLRRRLHAMDSVHLVTPSHWMAAEARAARVTKPVHVIPNGIPAEPYLSRTRTEARSRLEIDPAKTVLVFSAGHMSDERKNVSDAIAAVRNAGVPVSVILLGRVNDELRTAFADVDLIAPGYVSDRDVLADHLAAADAFLFTALAENHPLAVLEAMAAGTCIVGYDTGGVKEQVVNGETGLLVPAKDTAGLSALIRELDRGRLAALGLAARKRFESEFTIETMTARYLDLYAEILGTSQLRQANG